MAESLCVLLPKGSHLLWRRSFTNMSRLISDNVQVRIKINMVREKWDYSEKKRRLKQIPEES